MGSEREQIVKWLRGQAAGFDALNLVWMGDFLRQRAYQILNGVHLDDDEGDHLPTERTKNGR